MFRYRYRRDFLPDDELVERCNALGQEGWSLVGPPRWVPPPAQWPQESLGVWACFFKKTISNREQLAEVFSFSPEGRKDVLP